MGSAAATAKKPRLLIADDHTLVIEGLKRILESECELLGTAEDGRELLRAASELQPDVVLVDISMPLLNGIEAARQLLRTNPLLKVIFVTMHADPDYVSEAFRAGASGYILKRSAASELMTAIREAMAGHSYVTPLLKRDSLAPLFGGAGAKTPSSRLTARQREVLQLVAEGRSVKEIASILDVSAKTVEFHKSGLMERLGIRTTAELTRYAIGHGLVTL